MSKWFTIQATTIDERNGDLLHLSPPKAFTQAAALRKLRELYEAQLKAWDLDDNGAGRDGETVPGGCWCGDSAMLYAMPQSACGCLIQVCFMCVTPIDLSEAGI